jgi:hypothetical protein
MGAVKGTFDILAALTRLKREGFRFTLLAASHGSADDEARFARAVAAGDLTDRVRQVPFLPHQRIPSFLRACSMACVLEREFPIAAHAPGTPIEVLACGTPLVVSAEIARKQIFAPRLVHGRNVLIVRDPRDTDELSLVLREALEDPSALSALGLRGARIIDESVSATDRVRVYERLLTAAVDGTHASADGSPIDSGDGEGLGEEEVSWAALQKPHPAIATSDVLDVLLYRGLDASEPEPASIPALAPNVVIRPFSRHMDADDLTPSAYAFQHLPFRDRTRIVGLSPGHHLLSRLVNGKRSLRAIAHAMDPGGDSLLQRLCAAARDLFDEGIIVFPREGVHTWHTRPTRRHLARL